MMEAKQAAERLLQADNILVISHASPDGDTLGSASALMRGLLQKGKRVRFACSDPVPDKFGYLFGGIPAQNFVPDFVCAVDLAGPQLFGKNVQEWANRVDLCIDHHGTNTAYARETLVDPCAAAACEVIYEVLGKMGVTITPEIADCLFTGLTTDTGCFQYSSVTPRTHRLAAELMENGARAAEINRQMFEMKSRARLEIERRALASMRFFCGGKGAVMIIRNQDMEQAGAEEPDLDGLPALPRQIEGVLAGVCVKEKPDGTIKVSLRTHSPLDAAEICSRFGGGGHKAAAGCSFSGISPQEAADRLEKEITRRLEETV